MKRKWYQYIAVLLICIFALTGCGSLQEKEKENQDSAPEIAGLTYEKTMDLTYAEEFDVYYYKDGYKLINIQESGKYLIVPEGKEAPEGLDEDIKIIQQPLQHVYMAASASMSLIASIGGGLREVFRVGRIRLVCRCCQTGHAGWKHDICREIQ